MPVIDTPSSLSVDFDAVGEAAALLLDLSSTY
jgi:hypothetical protein